MKEFVNYNSNGNVINILTEQHKKKAEENKKQVELLLTELKEAYGNLKTVPENIKRDSFELANECKNIDFYDFGMSKEYIENLTQLKADLYHASIKKELVENIKNAEKEISNCKLVIKNLEEKLTKLNNEKLNMTEKNYQTELEKITENINSKKSTIIRQEKMIENAKEELENADIKLENGILKKIESITNQKISEYTNFKFTDSGEIEVSSKNKDELIKDKDEMLNKLQEAYKNRKIGLRRYSRYKNEIAQVYSKLIKKTSTNDINEAFEKEFDNLKLEIGSKIVEYEESKENNKEIEDYLEQFRTEYNKILKLENTNDKILELRKLNENLDLLKDKKITNDVQSIDKQIDMLKLNIGEKVVELNNLIETLDIESKKAPINYMEQVSINYNNALRLDDKKEIISNLVNIDKKLNSYYKRIENQHKKTDKYTKEEVVDIKTKIDEILEELDDDLLKEKYKEKVSKVNNSKQNDEKFNQMFELYSELFNLNNKEKLKTTKKSDKSKKSDKIKDYQKLLLNVLVYNLKSKNKDLKVEVDYNTNSITLNKPLPEIKLPKMYVLSRDNEIWPKMFDKYLNGPIAKVKTQINSKGQEKEETQKPIEHRESSNTEERYKDDYYFHSLYNNAISNLNNTINELKKSIINETIDYDKAEILKKKIEIINNKLMSSRNMENSFEKEKIINEINDDILNVNFESLKYTKANNKPDMTLKSNIIHIQEQVIQMLKEINGRLTNLSESQKSEFTKIKNVAVESYNKIKNMPDSEEKFDKIFELYETLYELSEELDRSLSTKNNEENSNILELEKAVNSNKKKLANSIKAANEIGLNTAMFREKEEDFDQIFNILMKIENKQEREKELERLNTRYEQTLGDMKVVFKSYKGTLENEKQNENAQENTQRTM